MKIVGACLVAVLALGGLARPAQEEGDPRQRARTARDLSREGTAAIPRLEAMLSDPVVEVRVEAVKSLVEIDTQYSLDPLIAATRDSDAEVQVRATDGLVNYYLPGYVRTGLTASLRRVGSAIRARFTDTTGQVIDPHVQVRPEVIEALGVLARTSSSFEARANAARAVGILRGGAAIPKLVEAIRNSKNDQVIFEALIALQKIRDPRRRRALPSCSGTSTRRSRSPRWKPPACCATGRPCPRCARRSSAPAARRCGAPPSPPSP